MLVAIDKKSAERIKAVGYKTAHAIRSKFPLGELVCPFCDEIVFPRERQGFVLHFVHQHPCTSNIARHPESPEHEQGKFELARFLSQQIKDHPNESAKIEVEYRLSKCGENGRVADVALVYQNGNLLICECQLAKITLDELEQRTRDYYAIGADVLWFLGKDADTLENRTWLRSMFGSVGSLQFIYTSS
ncbi:competence protein CoiA [Chamaesiphon minutus]|uniref:Competence protein n=1 Tax=Chamaesiphon minutus (strain ATCC 27169 / PCC 6605) TaxID=1173020 RepID=K9UF66_CHAP6|nr:competence protein CoiA family protein [Chamaesiphon minutus]AFY93081.1 competence protein [Chamaesiphon minutus PCC 6605]